MLRPHHFTRGSTRSKLSIIACLPAYFVLFQPSVQSMDKSLVGISSDGLECGPGTRILEPQTSQELGFYRTLCLWAYNGSTMAFCHIFRILFLGHQFSGWIVFLHLVFVFNIQDSNLCGVFHKTKRNPLFQQSQKLSGRGKLRSNQTKQNMSECMPLHCRACSMQSSK